MSNSITAKIHERVRDIGTTPTIPCILFPLLDLLKAPPENAKLDEIVKLVSYDPAMAAQCLRVASSPLFALSKTPESIKSAVISLGLRRVETILLTCCMAQAFPVKNWALDPTTFWRHSLACAMVCRKFSDKLHASDSDNAYMAGLMHDLGFLVNAMAFPQEFKAAVSRAHEEEISLHEAELATMGFTHCQTGQALSEKWGFPDDIIQVITNHHAIEHSGHAHSLVALVHLSDLLCRTRNLGYGYYERLKADISFDPAWSILAKHYKELENVDLVRFTFELDDAVSEIQKLVSLIFGSNSAN
jgi:putative nucleotidyltransferase with HDIG domain